MDLLRHLRFFAAVAEERHYGRAASNLGMTQPPLSQGVQRLERHLGTRLFDRDSRGVRLTDAGKRLLPQATELIDAADRLRSTASALSASRPSVRFGVPPEVGSLGAATATALRSQFPDHDVHVVVEPTQLLLEQVRVGELDVAVIRHPAVVDGASAGDVIRIPHWLLLPPGHLSGKEAVGITALTDLPLAGPPRHHHPAAHDQLVDTLRRHGHPGTTVVTADPVSRDVLIATGRAAGLAVDLPPPSSGIVALRLKDDLLPLRLRVVKARPRPELAEAEILVCVNVVESALRDHEDVR